MSVSLRQKSARRECESKRSCMVTEGVIGFDRFGHQVWPPRGDPRIHVLTIIAERPAIKPAVLYGSEVVGHKIAAEFVALVDNRPKHAGIGFPCHSVWIAQA